MSKAIDLDGRWVVSDAPEGLIDVQGHTEDGSVKVSMRLPLEDIEQLSTTLNTFLEECV